MHVPVEKLSRLVTSSFARSVIERTRVAADLFEMVSPTKDTEFDGSSLAALVPALKLCALCAEHLVKATLGI